jgi:anti-anti-sigma factor
MSPGTHGNGFTISTHFAEYVAVLALSGTLDILAVPEFSATFDRAVAGGYPSIIVDLTDLDTMTSDGLALLAGAAEQLRALDRKISVRSPSVRVRRLLDAYGLKDLASVDEPGTTSSLRSHGQRLSVVPPLQSVGPGHLSNLQMGSTVASDNDVVDGALRMVVALTRVSMGAADGVSVSLRRRGRLATVAASDQIILDMDTHQYSTGEGPCIAASVEGRRFHARSLAEEVRWPHFTPKARALGINAILSAPLRTKDRPFGALNIYSRRPDVFAEQDEEMASALAAETSAILSGALFNVVGQQRDGRIQGALETRQAIALAQGVIMERRGISEDDAYTVLRIASQKSGRSLHIHASEVISASLRHGRAHRTGPVDDPDD